MIYLNNYIFMKTHYVHQGVKETIQQFQVNGLP